MEKRPLISIITPVYDVEPFIHDYLDSVLSQTYRNLEVICVDDGSPDRCGEILDDYAKKDTRLKVIHQENNGYSAAVNRGLDNATGDYIGFIDPDDWVEPDFYEETLKLAETHQADIVIAGFYRVYSHGSELMANSKPVPPFFEDCNEALMYGYEPDVYRGFNIYLWNKLFKSVYFDATNGGFGFRMDDDIVTGADGLLTAKCFLNAGRFAYCPKALCHHRIREDSMMRNKDFSRRIGVNYALERVLELLERNQSDKCVIGLVKRYHTYFCSQLAEYAYSVGDKENLEFSKKNMRKYLREYYAMNTQYPNRIERMNRIANLVLQ